MIEWVKNFALFSPSKKSEILQPFFSMQSCMHRWMHILAFTLIKSVRMYFYFLRFVSFFKSSALLMFNVHQTIIWIFFYKKKLIFLTCTLVFFSFNKPLKNLLYLYCDHVYYLFLHAFLLLFFFNKFFHLFTIFLYFFACLQ